MSSLTPMHEEGDPVCPGIPRAPLKYADTGPHTWHMWTDYPLSKFLEAKGSVQHPLLRSLALGDLSGGLPEGSGQGAHF